MYFPLLLQRKDTKGKQPEKPFLRERFLETFPKRGRGILAFEAKMLHTHKNLLNDPPTKRRVFLGFGLPAI